jgi:NAD dependent epimerase/dehydratase family enzyme
MVTTEDKEMEKSRVLIIGGTGHIGKHIVVVSLCLSHPTAVLIREFAPSDQIKVKELGWVNSGASLIKVPIIINSSSSPVG